MKHLVIPDCQVKPGHSSEYLGRIGHYIVDKKPDVIVCLGDFADMPSLSSYDKGTKKFEGARYLNDINASHEAMTHLHAPIEAYNAIQRKKKVAQYLPRKVMLYGNHEDRIDRAVNLQANLEGVLSLGDLDYSGWGWETHPFLEVVVIDGVAYSHYFTTGVMGRPCTSAAQQLNKKHMSCVAGHQQGKQIATSHAADGRQLTSIIAGSCYEHNEDYLGPQGNKHWRGIIMLHEINNGSFDEMFVSLNYLKQRYA